MPLINVKGQHIKVACGPCIRGHRSTGCKHLDRVLCVVRKPGRPLSTCPHRSATCSCADNFVSYFIPSSASANCYHLHDGTEPVYYAEKCIDPVSAHQSFSAGHNRAHKRSESVKAVSKAKGNERSAHRDQNVADRLEKHRQLDLPLGRFPPPSQAGQLFIKQESKPSTGTFPQHTTDLTVEGKADNLNCAVGASSTSPFKTTDPNSPHLDFQDFNWDSSALIGEIVAPNPEIASCPLEGSNSVPQYPRGSMPSEMMGPNTTQTNGIVCDGHMASTLQTVAVPFGQPANCGYRSCLRNFAHAPYPNHVDLMTDTRNLPDLTNGSATHHHNPMLSNNALGYNMLASGGDAMFLDGQYSSTPRTSQIPDTPGDTGRGCCCGPNCACVGCAVHPRNDATVNHVLGLNQFMMQEESSLAGQLRRNTMGHLIGPNQDLQSSQIPTDLRLESHAPYHEFPLPDFMVDLHQSLNPSLGDPNQELALRPTASPRISPKRLSLPNINIPDTADAIGDIMLSPSQFTMHNIPLASCSDSVGSCPCGPNCVCHGCKTHRNSQRSTPSQ